MVAAFQKADGLRVVTLESLTPTVFALLQDDAERTRLGQRALEVTNSQKGATQRTVSALLGLLQAESTPDPAVVGSEKQA